MVSPFLNIICYSVFHLCFYAIGKNAWKVGLLSLTGMGVLMGANLLFVWGAPIYDKEGKPRVLIVKLKHATVEFYCLKDILA